MYTFLPQWVSAQIHGLLSQTSSFRLHFLLYLLKEELKNNHNQKQQQIIHTILEQNPPVGNRNRYLTDIFNLLVNEGLSKKSIDTLSRYGIILNHTGKHPTTTFF